MKNKQYENTSVSEISSESKTDVSEINDGPSTSNVHREDYPELDNLKVITSRPSSLTYEELMVDTLPNIPKLLIELLSRVDREIPPLGKLCYGINEYTMSRCDLILDSLVYSEGNDGLCSNMIENCYVQEAVQLIQLLLLRLENPPFIASVDFCETLNKQGFFVTPRLGKRKDALGNRSRITRDCLRALTVHQKATLSYFIERCQKWCQLEVAYGLRKNPDMNPMNIYNEAIEFLSLLFADCLIGLPKHYVASRIIKECFEPIDVFKRDIFVFLIGLIGPNVWHANSIETLYVPKNSMKHKNTSISSDESPNKTHSLHKIRSFNWL